MNAGLLITFLFVAIAVGCSYLCYILEEKRRKTRRREKRWENRQKDFYNSLMAIEAEGVRARERILQEMMKSSARTRVRTGRYYEEY